MTFNERGLLTINEAAAWLGIGRTKLYELLSHRGGPIPTVMIGRAVRVPMQSLRAWLAQQVDAAAS